MNTGRNERQYMPARRVPFMGLAVFALLVGLTGGLQRIGWELPVSQVSYGHGAIMVGGFLGTLIILEKIIVLKKRLLYVIPVVSGMSVAGFIAGMQLCSFIFLVIASLALVIIFLVYWLRERSPIFLIMSAGAASWVTGNVALIITGFFPMAVPWWMAFALFIIAAERLELMKFLPVRKTDRLIFGSILTIFLISCIVSFHGTGRYLAAFAVVSAAVWLMRNDVISINLKKAGLTKYIGITLLCGYSSLLLCGVFLLITLRWPLGYDIVVHTFFIGFVISMIFAHGPVILPGVLGVSVKPFHSIFYFWLIVLHLSWVARVLADVILDMQVRKYSGLASAIVILGYFLSVTVTTIRCTHAKAV